jgi:hypothetical protein
MQSILQFLPLLVILCMYATFVRLAARITRASGVGWLRAFQFAALIVVLSVLGRVVSLYVGEAPLLLAGLFGITTHLALGAWFFRNRAVAADGQVVGWAGGAKLSAVALGLLLLVIVVLLGVVRALLPTMQP